MSRSGKLLIFAPVPLVQTDAGLHLEDQACNGLRLWAENFEQMATMHPVSYGPMPDNYRPISSIGPNLERIRVLPLPTAYRPDQFFRHYRTTRNLIREEIARADYLSFAIGGLFGDWGSVSCIQAHRMKRSYGVWTDRVQSEVVRRTAGSGPWRRRIQARLYHRPMAWLERYVIRRATLGLFQGRDTYETYAPYCRQPQLVYDINVSKAEQISAKALETKITASAHGPLKIVYSGRATAMKGPQDWITVLENLRAAGIDFQATWLGDGPELAQMKDRVATAGMQDRVHFTGFISDRAMVLDHLRKADIFLFCHKTPEAPRCLIEALISGAPLVGYHSANPQDLISEHGGGRLIPPNDTSALSGAVIELARDRGVLAEMIAKAARDGSNYDDESVFRHRSDIIKQFL